MGRDGGIRGLRDRIEERVSRWTPKRKGSNDAKKRAKKEKEEAEAWDRRLARGEARMERRVKATRCWFPSDGGP